MRYRYCSTKIMPVMPGLGWRIIYLLDANIGFSVINIKEDNAWQRRVEMIIILTIRYLVRKMEMY